MTIYKKKNFFSLQTFSNHSQTNSTEMQSSSLNFPESNQLHDKSRKKEKSLSPLFKPFQTNRQPRRTQRQVSTIDNLQKKKKNPSRLPSKSPRTTINFQPKNQTTRKKKKKKKTTFSRTTSRNQISKFHSNAAGRPAGNKKPAKPLHSPPLSSSPPKETHPTPGEKNQNATVATIAY